MEPVFVSTRNGSVYITQGYDSSEDSIVVVDPSQVPTLVQWLQEAAAVLAGCGKKQIPL